MKRRRQPLCLPAAQQAQDEVAVQRAEQQMAEKLRIERGHRGGSQSSTKYSKLADDVTDASDGEKQFIPLRINAGDLHSASSKNEHVATRIALSH